MIFEAILAVCVLGCVPAFGKSSCPNGWIPFNEKCYFISTVKADWQTSRARCISKGSHLATVKSAKEHNFLATYVKGVAIWLDGNDLVREGKWVWSNDNTPIGYKHWARGQPEGKRKQNCLVINTDYKWHDAGCSIQCMFACEKEMSKDNGQCLTAKNLLDELIKCKQRCKYP